MLLLSIISIGNFIFCSFSRKILEHVNENQLYTHIYVVFYMKILNFEFPEFILNQTNL